MKWKLAYRTRYVSGLYDVTAPARYRAWAVGQRGTDKNARPLILRWNGKTWGPVSVTGTPDFAPTSVRASSATDVWVFGDDYETTGTSIRKVPAPAVRLMPMGSIAAARDGQLWMLGRLAGNGQPPQAGRPPPD